MNNNEQNLSDQTKSPQPATVVSEPTQMIPHSETPVNDYDIDAFLEKRKEFIEKVNAIMVEKQDYHVIQGKKSLAKGGAEKIASIFGWAAEFTKDIDTIGSFDIPGLVAYTCRLTKVGQFVGEGRGAALLAKNNGDPNKTIKMAQKSAFIDGVLRASGLSDFFTQDLEDMPSQEIQDTPKTHTPDMNFEEARKAVMPICKVHNKQLRYGTYGYYCTTKLADGTWCKYKPPVEQGEKELPVINQDLDEEAKQYM